MSEVKNIKGIDAETWAEFKSLAAEKKLKAADMFKVMVKDYKSHAKNFWDELRSRKPIFSPEEYVEIEKKMKSFRKEYGWRI